jgi:hypothetical protein
MKYFLATLVAVVSMASVTAHGATNQFDGKWKVVVKADEYKDGKGFVSKSWRYDFDAVVTNGNLYGQYGQKGGVGSFQLSGPIDKNGDALLHGTGVTGKSQYTATNAMSGMPYSYDVKAHFSGNTGTGQRVNGAPYNFIFTKH